MPRLRLDVTTPDEFADGFAAIRAELDVPAAFPAAVDAAAETAAARGPVLPPGVPGVPADAAGTGEATRADRRDLDLVTIDPVGSRDLDQAYGAEQRGSGYRVHYAIADVAAFVPPGGALDDEAFERGVTLYCPDGRAPLYPPSLGEGAASLLAEVDRPAVLWTLDLDQAGVLVDVRVERATVHSRRMLDYGSVQAAIDGGTASPALMLLREIGTLREEQERARGGVSLNLPSQNVERQGDGTYALRYDGPLPVEGWNEQISLLTGMAAAQLMVDAGVGLLRTLPPAEAEVFDSLRRSAGALGVDWPTEVPYPEFVRGLDPRQPAHTALMTQSARVLRGASYAAFDGTVPEQPEHAAIASVYAHVTAPLRRLADRHVNEVLLSAAAGRRPPPWVLDALPDLPEIMNGANHHASALERAIADFMEAAVLAHRVGEEFDAVVTSAGKGGANVQLRDPAVLTTVADASLEPGSAVRLRLDAVDPTARTVTFRGRREQAVIGVTLVSHASVVIDTGSVRIWTDPWLDGKAFNDSWALLAPAAPPDPVRPPVDYLWISHEHADHFHVPTLRALPDEVKRHVTVLTRTGDAAKLTDALHGLGFPRVTPIAHRGRFALAGGGEAYSYEVGQMDTCLAVIDDGDVLLNANDAELSDTDCRLLRQDLGPCGTVLNQFSVAGYGGHPDHATHLAAQARRVLASLVRDHGALGADVTIPIASYVYFCREDNRYVNAYVNRPRDVERALAAEGLDAVVLAPGDTYTVGEAHDSAAALDWWDERYDRIDELPYDPVQTVALDAVRSAFLARCEQLRAVLPEAAVRRLGAVTASIPDLSETVRFDLGARTFETVSDDVQPDLTVNSQPLEFAFRQPYGVQTLGVSARVTVRPGDRRWRRHRIAFAVANSGLDLRWRHLLDRENVRWLRPRARGGLAQLRYQLRRNAT